MKSKGQLCPICGEGHVWPQTLERTVTEGVTSGVVAMHVDVCDSCGEESIGLEASRFNKRQVMAFRKHVAGLLPGEEIARIRAKYDVNQREAAAIFGGGPVAFSKYESDDVAQSAAMDKTLRVCGEFPPAFYQYAELAAQHHLFAERFEECILHATRNVAASGLARGIDEGTLQGIIRATMQPEMWERYDAEHEVPIHLTYVAEEKKAMTWSAGGQVPPLLYREEADLFYATYSYVEAEEISFHDWDDESSSPSLMKAA
jgi:putative zinc finger/helix-turn-helix YgiT family protein